METVGYDPWRVSIKMKDSILRNTANPISPSIEGIPATQFIQGDGRAIFDDILITGDLESAKFEFFITTDEGTVAPVVSNMIEFMPAVSRGPCTPEEGGSFDKKESWSSNCDYVCQSSCFDLSGITSIQPICYETSNCNGKYSLTF